MIKERWCIGDVTITKVMETESVGPGGGRRALLPDAFPEAVLQMPWLIPDFATEEGHLRMSIHALLVQTPDHRLVIDTCVGNDKSRRYPAFDRLATAFLADLETHGWPCESVDGVLCTHLHVDHVGWNTVLKDGVWRPTFPNARYYMGRTEFEHWAREFQEADAERPSEPAVVFADSVKPVFDAGLVDLVETNAVIAPGVRLISTLGHSPGHVSIVVESRGETAVITGDMVHHPCQVGRPQWSSSFDFDADQARRTRNAFFETYADTGVLIIGTHFSSPTAGRLVRDVGGYRFVTVAASEAGEPATGSPSGGG